jgi:hypothetical protein
MIVLRYTPARRDAAPGRRGRSFRPIPPPADRGAARASGSPSGTPERYILGPPHARTQADSRLATAINRFGAAAGCERGRKFALAKWPVWALTRGRRRAAAFGYALPGLAPTAYYRAAGTRQIDRRG